MSVNTDPDNLENLLRQVIREEVWGASVQAIPFSEFSLNAASLTTTLDTGSGTSITAATTTGVDGDAVTTTDTVILPQDQRPTTGALRIISAPNTQPLPDWVEGVRDYIGAVPAIFPEPMPYPEIMDQRVFERELMERLGLPRDQSITLPEGMEMLKECQIADAGKGKKAVELELRIRGPVIPKSLLKQIPESMFRTLDLEIKRAVIRAFNLQPTEELRKRTIIVEEEE